MGEILLRKLGPRGKVYVARNYRKSWGVCNAHFVHGVHSLDTIYKQNTNKTMLYFGII